MLQFGKSNVSLTLIAKSSDFDSCKNTSLIGIYLQNFLKIKLPKELHEIVMINRINKKIKIDI